MLILAGPALGQSYSGGVFTDGHRFIASDGNTLKADVEAYSANAGNLSSGTVACARLPAFSGDITNLNCAITIGANKVVLADIATIGANTMLGNWSGVTSTPAAWSMPPCNDSAGQHLNYVSGAGITCGNTSSGTFLVTSGSSILYGNGSGGLANVTLGAGLTFSGGVLAASGGGTVTSVTCNAGLTGGAITTTGTCALDLAHNNTWTAAQRGAVTTLAISTATFTPNFDTAQNFALTLVHASCPCTLANPSTTPVAGQSGVIEVIQSATGSDTIGTWGSQYVAAGGVSTVALSSAANAPDVISYYVVDSTHILISMGALNAIH